MARGMFLVFHCFFISCLHHQHIISSLALQFFVIRIILCHHTDILIHIANPSPNSIVLDPCAGIGTIPLRASLRSHYGLGGELSPHLFWDAAPHFFNSHHHYRQCTQNDNDIKNNRIAEMAGWDATMLPLRDSFVDIVISDIPFGQVR